MDMGAKWNSVKRDFKSRLFIGWRTVVDGEVFGPLGVARSPAIEVWGDAWVASKSAVWMVVHLRTGHAVARDIPTRDAAIKLVRALERTSVDWSFRSPKATPELKKTLIPVARIVNRHRKAWASAT